MSVQIKSVTLYSSTGEIRALPFKLGAVNIITGKSRTGKSAIIDIVDYCLGRSTFTIFEGVNRASVAWYAVTLRVNESEVFIAKPPPEGAFTSQSGAYFRVATDIDPPPMSELAINTNDDAVVELLSGLLGISSNLTVEGPGRSSTPFQATLKHAKFFLFQEQGVVANRSLLFHRQSESFVEQHIKDTLPYFLGAVQEDRLRLLQDLREAKRDLNRARRALAESEAVTADRSQRATALVAEAQEVGLLAADAAPGPAGAAFDLLREVDEWTPNSATALVGEQRLMTLQSDLSEARRLFRDLRERLRQAEGFSSDSQGFTREVSEQVNRLEAIDVFARSTAETTNCPLCASELASPPPSVRAMTEALDELRTGLGEVERERPRVQEHVEHVRNQLEQTRDRIRELEGAIRAIVAESDAGDRWRSDARAARVAGRVSLFLESVSSLDQNSSLRDAVREAEAKVGRLEALVDTDEVEDVLASVLSVLSTRMSRHADQLDLEHKGNPFRLDIKKLTVVADTPERPISMSRMGSGENWLGCHLIAHAALHEHFVKGSRPVPNFLILDQPSQVYFPSADAYRALDGTVDEMLATDADITAVTRMFDFLFDLCEKLAPDFQIIVTEHANLPNPRYQAALVEEPWIGGRALVPLSWISSVQS